MFTNSVIDGVNVIWFCTFGNFTDTVCIVVILYGLIVVCIKLNSFFVKLVRLFIAAIPLLSDRTNNCPFCKLLNDSVEIVALTISVFLNVTFVIIAFVKFAFVAIVFVKLEPLKSILEKSIPVLSCPE